MTGNELLPLIRSYGRDDRYSENLMKWVRKYKDRELLAAFFGYCNVTGEPMEYDPAKTIMRQIVIGVGDMSDGSVSGRRLTDILCGERGVFSNTYFYGPAFLPVEIPDFWQRYVEVGKCFLDPEHSTYREAARWEVSEDGKNRHCVWCGKHDQYLHSETETVVKTFWRSK